MSDEERLAYQMNEEVEGIVQCNSCAFWGVMDGVIEYADKKHIKFICPDCKAIELVRNPDFIG